MPKFTPPCLVVNSDGTSVFEARIEDGKLFYDKKWLVENHCYYYWLTSCRFHKNQMIFIESKEHGQER